MSGESKFERQSRRAGERLADLPPGSFNMTRPLAASTPVPSGVAETTAGEREVEALFDCSCGHSIAEHNGLGCYARLSYTPLVTCECPLTDDRTHGELLAPRLAALLDRVRREEGERIARAIEAGRTSRPVGVSPTEHAASIARAASVGRGEWQ